MKRIPKELRPIIIVAALFAVVMLLAPAQGRAAGAASLEYLKEMALMKAKFMGIEFALLRLGLTVVASIAIAWVMQRMPSPQVPAQPSMIEDRASANG